MKRLDGQSALVTGAAHGIGAAIAERLAADGARVMIADIDMAGAEALATSIRTGGGEARVVRTDVTERAHCEQAVAAAVAWSGRLDLLVANAGIMDRAPFLEMSEEVWTRIQRINLFGTFFTAQAAARQMVAQNAHAATQAKDDSRRGGRIITISSNSGLFGGRGRAAYGATKAGIIKLTQSMAIELAEHAILVNSVAPCAIKTGAMTGDLPAAFKARMPLGRFGEPHEVAGVVSFLASADASFITGQTYATDGGFTTAGVMEG